jgi:acyl-CoA thioesterase-1
MKLRSLVLGAVMAIVLPSVVCFADDAKCRASRRLLDLGNPLEVARASVAEKKELRIVAMGSSSTQGYGASNPSFAYPAQLKMNLDKILPGVDVHVFNKGVGGEDADEEVKRMNADVKDHKAQIVVWQVGTNSAIRRTPLDKFAAKLREPPVRARRRGAP